MTASTESRHDWAIVLAGGSGTRLTEVTGVGVRQPVPKQYCSLRGGSSLLTAAVERAAGIVRPDHIVIVVAAEHRRFWERDLGGSAGTDIVVQPRNCGTAPGILLPLLTVLERDPRARILLVPSDHFVAREDVLACSLRQALASTAGRSRVELMGIGPDTCEPGYGWILSGPERGVVRSVARFVEKPEGAVAADLFLHGALWNSFLVAAAGQALIGLYQLRLPGLLDAFLRACPHRDGRDAARLYRTLATADFSQHLLAGAEPFLRVRQVPACGWTDLGTRARVLDCLRRHAPAPLPPCRGHARAALDLAAALAASAAE